MQCIIHTDGGSRGNPGPAGYGVVVLDAATLNTITELKAFLGQKTNNEAEYQGLLAACEWLKSQTEFEITEVTFKLDSRLVVEQVQKHWKINEVRLREFAEKIWQILPTLPYSVKFIAVPRAENAAADALANQAMDQGTMN